MIYVQVRGRCGHCGGGTNGGREVCYRCRERCIECGNVRGITSVRNKGDSGRCRRCANQKLARGTSERNHQMASLRAMGLSFEEVGKRYGVTRQRVQQIIARERVV